MKKGLIILSFALFFALVRGESMGPKVGGVAGKANHQPLTPATQPTGSNPFLQGIFRFRRNLKPDQTSMWQGMDPVSLLKLLNTLASSKEAMADRFYEEDDEEDEPIDLMYSGRKPFTSPTEHGPYMRNAIPMVEPINIMSGNLGKARRFYADDEDFDAPPLQLHRLSKPDLFVKSRRRRSYGMSPLRLAFNSKANVHTP